MGQKVKCIKSHIMISAPGKVFSAQEGSKGEIMTGTFAVEYPLNILIAEDNIVNQKLIERILNKLGYQIDIAVDGIQAISLFDQKKHNAILMDVRMPVMDGYETTRVIRQKGVDQPFIIAMTANAMSNDRDECLQYGMNDYIPKPISITDVITKLKIAAEYCRCRK